MSTRPGVRGRTPWLSQGSPEHAYEALCARQTVTYTCTRRHVFQVVFSATATAPETWDCRCGQPAGLGTTPDSDTELARRLAQVRERRRDDELEQLLTEQLKRRPA